MLSQSRLLVSLSHLVGVGGRRLEAVALVLHDGGGGVLADLGLIWIGFPFEMMMMRIGERERGFLLYGIRTPVEGTRPGS